jgi:hypothetical protein
MSNRVLVVACHEKAREPAYHITEFLTSNGYSSQTCRAKHDESEVKADVTLNEETSLEDYDAVIFLDDGGDDTLSKKLAKKALNKGLVLGGFSQPGCMILAQIGALKDANVCEGLPDEAYKGVKKQVSAPAVRSDDIVTGTGDCALGFGVVLVDALGGKVKKIVESEDESAGALVIADSGSWPRWWSLAQVLSSKGLSLGITEWENIDVTAGMAMRTVIMRPDRRSVTVGNIHLPRSVLVRDGGLDEIKALEAVGCRNVNSSHAIEAISEADIIAEASLLIDPPKSGDVMRKGRVSASKNGRIVGRGDVALFSKDGTNYEILDRPGANKIAKKMGAVCAGIEEKVLLHRSSAGWVALTENEAVAEVAIKTALVSHAMVDDPDSLGEIEVNVSVSEDGAVPSCVCALPSGDHDVSESMARNAKREHLRYDLERDLGNEGVFLQPDGQIAIRAPRGLRTFPAEDAISFLVDLAQGALGREVDAMESGKEVDAWDERASRRHRHVLRCLLGVLHETGILADSDPEVVTAATKVAYRYDYGHTSVGGANFGLASDFSINARVWPWEEDADFLERGFNQPMTFGGGQGEPGKAFYRNLRRYNPEYEDQKSPHTNTWGVYYVWEEPRRTPYSWSNRFIDGVYPMNKSLKP